MNNSTHPNFLYVSVISADAVKLKDNQLQLYQILLIVGGCVTSLLFLITMVVLRKTCTSSKKMNDSTDSGVVTPQIPRRYGTADNENSFLEPRQSRLSRESLPLLSSDSLGPGVRS